jgi:hypothetical protein
MLKTQQSCWLVPQAVGGEDNVVENKTKHIYLHKQ